MVSVTVTVTGMDALVERLQEVEGALQAWSGSRISVGTNVNYAEYVHEGTWKMKGRPFLTDALRDEQPGIEADIRAGIEAVLANGRVSHDLLHAAFLRAGNRVLATAMRNTPVKTGTLRRSLHTTFGL